MHSLLGGVVAIVAGLASRAAAAASAYTDANTGITFQTYFASDMGFSFGIVVPETVQDDFIGQMVVPLTDGEGWGGVSLGGGMTGSLLFVAWSNKDDIVTSFRQASSYATPDVYSDADVSALTIANGTFVNSSHVSVTFLCQGCIVGGDATFTAATANPVLGYAVASTNPDTPSDATSTLVYHDSGANEWGFSMSAAKAANFDTWASWASSAGAGSSTGGSNSTTMGGGQGGSNSNSTVPVTTSNATYDVIVVGGGPAGIIAAARLAEAGSSVLLIERGPANTVALGSTEGLSWNSSLTPYDVPALGSSLTGLSGIQMCSDTASTAGCLLGGSSSINGENFIRPAQHDFERWPAGWRWDDDDMRAAADRLYARNPGTTQPSDDGTHYDDHAYTVVAAYLDAAGWSEVDSIAAPNDKQSVYSRPAWSIANHVRAGPARTYLPAAQALDNFALQLNTKVVQVRRNGSSVTGVLAETGSDGGSQQQQIIQLNAGGKVVLAAGALSTPRILWNSGIGRSDALAAVRSGTTGVQLPDEAECIDLPVGHHLQDHAQVAVTFTTRANFSAFDFAGVADAPAAADLALYYQGAGVMTQAAQRMHLWTTAAANSSDGRVRYLQGTVSAMADSTVTVKAFLTHGTSSTGELALSSAGATQLKGAAPWLRSDDDRAAMVGFVQWWLDITSSNNATAHNSSMACSSGATAEAIVSDGLVSGDHWVGTARMGVDDGREDNGTAVVDADTRVYGTDNLFVVDASIHPDLPTGNTQAMVMVVAEHAAHKIARYDVGSARSETAGS